MAETMSAPDEPAATGDHVPVCGIGASAGGVAALSSFFGHIKPDLGIAYVVITHLEPTRPTQLPEILAMNTTMPVEEVTDRVELAADHVYVIGPDRRLAIEADEVIARPFDEARGMRAPIDLFFRSLAEGRPDGYAIVLSGAGSDGAVGVRAVKENGGVVFVQDPAEAEYHTMPRAAIATGVADFIAPVAELAEHMSELASSREALLSLDDRDGEGELRRIVGFLHARTGHNFADYKTATVMRRVIRRMQITRQSSLSAYSRFLRDTPEEAGRLLNDLLISVTMFFRDPEAFETLARDVIPKLLDEAGEEGEIRVWAVGCATGEEAYSLAILFLEEAERRNRYPNVQIFGTDLGEAALATARQGLYPSSIEADISPERLKRFFVREDAHYRVRRDVRDLVLFANHSGLKDPPFLNINLISCRNLLIYLERKLQRELCMLLHYALVPGGFMVLGSAETTDAAPELFQPVSREHRVYRSRDGVARSLPAVPMRAPYQIPRPAIRQDQASPDGDALIAARHLDALERASPPSVLVDTELRVVHLSATAGRFLLPNGGPFSSDLLSLVRPELRTDLRGAIQRVFDDGEPTLTFPIAVAFNGVSHRVTVHVSRVNAETHQAPRALVLFLDGGEISAGDGGNAPGAQAEPGDRERKLREEMESAHARLAASQRGHRESAQELRAANEELQSINEEYRSTSEELETSKEELQSMNEELQTVNDELSRRLETVSTARSDLENMIVAADLGTLFLDPELRIKLFTPKATELFRIGDGDIGRPLTDFSHLLITERLEADVAAVLRDLTPIETEIATRDERWMLMRVRPYRTGDDRIDGVVVTFIDITRRREGEERLREAADRLRSILDAAAVVAIDWNALGDELHYEGPIERVIPATAGRPVETGMDLLASAHRNDRESAEAALRRAAAGPDAFHIEFRSMTEGGKASWVRINGSGVQNGGGRVLATVQDVSDLKNAETLALLVAELNHRVKNMLAVIVSIADQTLATSPDPADFNEAFAQRLKALSAAHDLLTETNWTGASLSSLIDSTMLTLLGDDKMAETVSLDGPPTEVSAEAAVTVGIALHELGTNALKYGSLSIPGGTVSVSWRIADGGGGRPWVTLRWVEEDGPPVAPPVSKGFGSTIIEGALAHELDGKVTLDYAEKGLTCTVEFPLDEALNVR